MAVTESFVSDQMIMSASVHPYCVNISDLTGLLDTHGYVAKRNTGNKAGERRRSTEGNTVVRNVFCFHLTSLRITTNLNERSIYFLAVVLAALYNQS